MSRTEALQKLKRVLVNRREAIRSALKGDLEALERLSLASGDLADFALDTSREEVASHMAEVESRELSQIEDALARINQGDFGTCEGCDKPIPLARLEALPFATLCIKCQTKLEKSGVRDWSQLQDSAYDST